MGHKRITRINKRFKDTMKCYHICFNGSVQGVGFRYTAQSAAAEYGICGWVMNMPDGGVEIMAQGDSAKLDTFIYSLKESFKRNITSVNFHEIECDDSLIGFNIKYFSER